MSKIYEDAVEEGFSYWDHLSKGSPVVRELVTIGYRAGLEAATSAVQSVQVPAPAPEETERATAIALGKTICKGIVVEKLQSLKRKVEPCKRL